VQKINKESWN